MAEYALLISPKAWAAYFTQTPEIVAAELELIGRAQSGDAWSVGDLHFLTCQAEPLALRSLARLSFVQGVFEKTGAALTPLAVDPGFNLHPNFVWGEKYRGKTNETLTQLLINLALWQCPDAETLLDPMCGRGTTLAWAMRYGLNATGIEKDPKAMPELRRGLKKWSKLHRQKHKLEEGWVQKTNKAGIGKFLEFRAEGLRIKHITGDSVDAQRLLHRNQVDIIASDLPYGVQHIGETGTRNPLQILETCAEGWAASLKPGGVMVLAFNANLPKRAALRDAFAATGLEEVDTPFQHRMSESILRDIVIMRKHANAPERE